MKDLKKISQMLSFENYIYDEAKLFSKDSMQKAREKKLFFLAKLEAKKQLLELCSGLKFDLSSNRFSGSYFKACYRNKEIKISLGHKFTSSFCENIGKPSLLIKNKTTDRFLFKKYFRDCEDMFTTLTNYKSQIHEALLHNKEFIYE